MRYGEAFTALGYKLEAPRTDWSAENDTGVCISIWQSEMKFENGRPWFDTKAHGGPLEIWRNLPGNRKRIRHLARATESLEGYIDVVIVKGIPGQGVTDADPWLSRQRGETRWRVTTFDPATGHFSAEIELAKR